VPEHLHCDGEGDGDVLGHVGEAAHLVPPCPSSPASVCTMSPHPASSAFIRVAASPEPAPLLLPRILNLAASARTVPQPSPFRTKIFPAVTYSSQAATEPATGACSAAASAPPPFTETAVALAPPVPGAGAPGTVGALPSAVFVHDEPDSKLSIGPAATVLPQTSISISAGPPAPAAEAAWAAVRKSVAQ
jgi:hypothetical protein